MPALTASEMSAAAPGGNAGFTGRLRRALSRVDLPDVRVYLGPTHQGSDWKHDAVVVSPAFAGMPQHERGRIVHETMLEHLWEEQDRVGGLFAYTPEEWAANSGDAEPPAGQTTSDDD